MRHVSSFRPSGEPAMTKTVLLARPHPFIAAEMRSFMEESGYSPSKLETLDSLPGLVGTSAGVVISMALSSAVGESAEEVFQQIRKVSARVPVLFAAMLPFDKVRPGLERVAKQAAPSAMILGLDSVQAGAGQLGRPDTLLYLSKDDLTSVARRSAAARLIQRHFL
jgi:hypothetical protein